MLSDLYRGDGEYPGRPHAGVPVTGRHALDEDALFTPIFHAMTRDDLPVVREPLRVVDDVDRFRRDPLTAPIPIPVLDDAWLPEMPARPRGRVHEYTGRRSVRSASDVATSDLGVPIRRAPVHEQPRSPGTTSRSGFHWDGREWRAPEPVVDDAVPSGSNEWAPSADPAYHVLTDTGRHHLYREPVASGW